LLIGLKIKKKKKKTRSNCSLQETHLTGKDTQTESERMENTVPSKWKPKESRSSYTHISENKFQVKRLK
jgi:hypothetical protein